MALTGSFDFLGGRVANTDDAHAEIASFLVGNTAV